MKAKTYKAWAIETNSPEGHGFIGRYWWFEGKHPGIPTHMLGNRVALFETRAAARDGLKYVKDAWPMATVRRVKVTIEAQS